MKSVKLNSKGGELEKAGASLVHGIMASELGLKMWSVISERGREASRLTYEDARRVVHKLAGEGRHGLCIITDTAANRMCDAEVFATKGDIAAIV